MEARSRAEREARLSARRGLRALRGMLMCGGVLLLASIAVTVLALTSERPPMTMAELAEAVGPIGAGESGRAVELRVWPILVGPSADWLVGIVQWTLVGVVVGSCWVEARAWSWRGRSPGPIVGAMVPGMAVGGVVAFLTILVAAGPTMMTTSPRVWHAAAALRGENPDSPPRIWPEGRLTVGLEPSISASAGAMLFGGGVLAMSLGAIATAWPASIMWYRHRRRRAGER